jgi:hypothetical protein
MYAEQFVVDVIYYIGYGGWEVFDLFLYTLG